MSEARPSSHDGALGTFLVRLNHTAIAMLATAMQASGPVQAGSSHPAAPETAPAAPTPPSSTAGPEQHATIHAL